MRISTAITTLLLSAMPATASASAGTAWITPFDLLADGSVVVSVTIGGTGPYRFVLDTGSSRTVVSTRLSQALKLPVVAATPMVTPAGRQIAYVVRLDGLAIGARPPVSVAAAAMPADRYAAGQQVDGLIGQDVLGSVVYTIDYDARTIYWHGTDDAVPGVRLPLTVTDNRVLVSLPQFEGDANPLSLIPDSGSDGLVLFPHAQNKVRLTPLDVGVLTSLSGSRLAQRVQLERLVIGNTQLASPLAVLVNSGESADIMGDGLLPLHLFSRVTLNVAERYLVVAPR